MTTTRRLTAVVFLTLTSVAAQAATRIALELNSIEYDYPDVDSSFGYRIAVGHTVPDAHLLIEGGYRDSGNADITGLPLSLNYRGWDFAVGYVFTPRSAFPIWIKGGGYSGKQQLKGSGGSFRENSRGMMLGFGVDWMFSKHFGLRGELELLPKFKDFAEDKTADALNIGLVYVFGSDMRAKKSSRIPAPSMPEPGAEPDTSTTFDSGVQSIAPASAAMPPLGRVPGARATLLAGTNLRGRPASDALPLAVLLQDSTVTLLGEARNAEGTWWYVGADSGKGWVQEYLLSAIAH